MLRFEILPDKNKTDKQTTNLTGSLYFFGFESTIKGLVLMIKDNQGQHQYKIQDTSYGFAEEDLRGTATIWFEYTKSDQIYTINLFSNDEIG